jgi:hypothetical protein
MNGFPGLKRIDQCLLTVKVFKRNVQVKFSSVNYCDFVTPEEELRRQDKKRSKIIRFSKRSARRLRHLVRNTEDMWKVFITLTYPENFPCNGREVKMHLNAFLQYLRRKKIRSVWILEFQSRGAPHYHIIASGEIPKDEIAERWHKIVGSGDKKHLRAGTRIEGIKSKGHLYGYLYNYIKKSDQKTPPEEFGDVGRFWGSSRNLLTFEGFERIDHFYKLVWSIKLIRNWYKAHLRKFGIRWRWKGRGFIALDGVPLVNQIMSLRC